MVSSGINLVMTVIGFCLSVMFIVFVCTRLICASIHLTITHRSTAHSDRLSTVERGLQGLEPREVSKFPTKEYSDKFFSSSDHNQCAVCLSEYHQEDTLRIFPNCEHFFHVACIDQWLQLQSTCPICRISLRAFHENKQNLQPSLCSSLQAYHSTGSLSGNMHIFMLPG